MCACLHVYHVGVCARTCLRMYEVHVCVYSRIGARVDACGVRAGVVVRIGKRY